MVLHASSPIAEKLFYGVTIFGDLFSKNVKGMAVLIGNSL
jgi:hypothetical protein